MLVTVNTDASYNHKFKIGSYAFWITSKYGRFRKSGILRGHIPSSLYAETKAIGNAIAFLYDKSGLYPYVTKIIINTDCEPAIHLLTYNHDAEAKHADLRNKVLKILNQKHGVKRELRHVKAHNGTDDKRSYVNNWCDREAKKQIGIKLRKLEKQ